MRKKPNERHVPTVFERMRQSILDKADAMPRKQRVGKEDLSFGLTEGEIESIARRCAFGWPLKALGQMEINVSLSPFAGLGLMIHWGTPHRETGSTTMETLEPNPTGGLFGFPLTRRTIPNQITITRRFVRHPRHAREVVEMVFQMCEAFIGHELRESFLYDHKRICDPHEYGESCRPEGTMPK